MPYNLQTCQICHFYCCFGSSSVEVKIVLWLLLLFCLDWLSILNNGPCIYLLVMTRVFWLGFRVIGEYDPKSLVASFQFFSCCLNIKGWRWDNHAFFVWTMRGHSNSTIKIWPIIIHNIIFLGITMSILTKLLTHQPKNKSETL